MIKKLKIFLICLLLISLIFSVPGLTEKLIDEFGGVTIDVERDLVDPEFPIRGKEYVFPIENRYEILRINAGVQHMDGELALKYARSRHALGIEGSDFARSKRQQKILAYT